MRAAGCFLVSALAAVSLVANAKILAHPNKEFVPIPPPATIGKQRKLDSKGDEQPSLDFFGNVEISGGAPAVMPELQLLRNQHGLRVMPTTKDVNCDYFPEVVLVQDISWSFLDDMVNMRRLMPQLFEFFKNRFGNHVRFGVTSFTDKNTDPWGNGNFGDFCARLELPLTHLTEEGAFEKVVSVYNELAPGGGNDFLDSSNEALVRSALSDHMGWSKENYDPATGRPIIRIIILATDAGFHEAGYAQQLLLESGHITELFPPNTFPDQDPDVDFEEGCHTEDFPTTEQLADALASRNIIPVVFAGSPYFISDGVKKIYMGFKNQVVDRYNRTGTAWDDMDTGLVAFYGDFMRDFLGRDTVVQHLDDDSANFVELMEKAMGDIDNLLCLPPPTEEPVPTTTTTEAVGGGLPPAAIGAAAGGGALAAAAAGLAAARKMGFLFNSTPEVSADSVMDVDNVDVPGNREQFEEVTGDLFA